MTMISKRRKRLVAVEISMAGLSGVLAGVTIFWRDWLELLFHWDPDHHSGTAEFLLIVGLAALSLVLGCAARWQTVRWTTANAPS
jgi:hypothetical protein